MNIHQTRLKKKIILSFTILFALLMIIGSVFTTTIFAQGMDHSASGGQESAIEHISDNKADISKFALIAAAAAFGLGALSAGFAIAHVGAAAMGAVAEKPEIAGQALIFIALAEGLVVFGFITALMILGKA